MWAVFGGPQNGSILGLQMDNGSVGSLGAKCVGQGDDGVKMTMDPGSGSSGAKCVGFVSAHVYVCRICIILSKHLHYGIA